MEKKLPNVYVNNNAKLINANNKEVFYSFYETKFEDNNYKKIDIRKKTDEIFSSTKYSYKVNVLIITKDNNTIYADVISKAADYILTIKGERIYYNDILYIEKING